MAGVVVETSDVLLVIVLCMCVLMDDVRSRGIMRRMRRMRNKSDARAIEEAAAVRCANAARMLGKVLEMETGATREKRRFLERLDWKVVNIPFVPWDKARSEEEKQEFLRNTVVDRF